MIRTNTCLLLCALALYSAPALAGPLATASGVYVDGFAKVWHGSTHYVNGNLEGDVDWAVWAPNTFPSGALDYTPYVGTAGEFVYAYQVYETGSAALSQFSVSIANPADNDGYFTGDAGDGPVTGVPPDFSTITGTSVEWFFFSAVEQGNSTSGLAFSSAYSPINGSGLVVDDGTSQFVVPVPTPGGPIIPEPSTLVLASCGMGVIALGWLRRRGRKGG
jgi:hypothetical protein